MPILIEVFPLWELTTLVVKDQEADVGYSIFCLICTGQGQRVAFRNERSDVEFEMSFIRGFDPRRQLMLVQPHLRWGSLKYNANFYLLGRQNSF